jgi:SOS-response transcriptional repressor LexA
MTLGSRIRAKRKAKAMTLQQLGDVFGISRSSVSEWESDRSRPSNDKLMRLAEVLSTSVNELLADDGNSGQKLPLIEVSKTHTSDTLIAPDMTAPTRTAGKLPVLSWIQAGEWGEIVDNLREQGVQEWESCPFEGDFILPVIGDSNFNPGGERSYREGEHLSVSTKIEPRHRSMVIVKRKGEASAICRQLLIENDGVLMLQALNPSWPERYTKVDRDTEIIGVVTGKWESQL